ncbi:hypothetical protein [Halalkalibacter krulwichiae]|uniref:Pilus assembly protein, PilO n=1 Tax=Halalkalibacter krulwichiae TaxID=199441 RepID=A0A1X9MGF9_9BACI|nr:hypothetical protein [Halalkalibacter krulwichiae]ARK31600.1 hypothetical protein BkAM31D_18080 [Halalkalibacter krulwichiae]
MNEWFIRNQKPVLYFILLFFLGLVAFYLYQVRPLQAKEQDQQAELQRITNSLQTYQQHLDNSEKQKLSDEEESKLLALIPLRPDIEQMVADLERTELDTDVVIERIDIEVSPLEAPFDEETDAEVDQNQSWRHLFSEELYASLEEEVTELEHINLAYVELVLSILGEEDDLHSFVDEIEQLDRIVHIQNYSYVVAEDSNHVEGVLTLRAFYSEDFSPFMEETKEFELDYQFDSAWIKSYLEKVTTVETIIESSMIGSTEINGEHAQTSINSNTNTNQSNDSSSQADSNAEQTNDPRQTRCRRKIVIRVVQTLNLPSMLV